MEFDLDMDPETIMRVIAFYGKGGIGKTTVASSMSELFAESGKRVLQIGCDPKHDSCYKLVPRGSVRTVMGVLQERSMPLASDIIMPGVAGVHCIETGGPEPGVGCAGRGITKMFETLRELGLPGDRYDVVVCDVLGDIVCGGFAVPMRSGFANEIYIVLSGEVMAMYAANNICRAVVKYSRSGVRLGGLVANLRAVPREEETLLRFADSVGARLLHPIPRDETVQLAERVSRTVISHAPESEAARHYRMLFDEITARAPSVFAEPKPMSDEEFDEFVAERAFGA